MSDDIDGGIASNFSCFGAVTLVFARVNPTDIAVGAPVYDVQSTVAGIAEYHRRNIGEVHTHNGFRHGEIFNNSLVFGDDYGMVSTFAYFFFIVRDRLVGGQDILLGPSSFGPVARRVVVA